METLISHWKLTTLKLVKTGGGRGMCQGRKFAGAEILLVVATIVSRFEIEFEQWVKLDGSSSARPALGQRQYSTNDVIPPDRDMQIRWRRKW